MGGGEALVMSHGHQHCEITYHHDCCPESYACVRACVRACVVLEMFPEGSQISPGRFRNKLIIVIIARTQFDSGDVLLVACHGTITNQILDAAVLQLLLWLLLFLLLLLLLLWRWLLLFWFLENRNIGIDWKCWYIMYNLYQIWFMNVKYLLHYE